MSVLLLLNIFLLIAVTPSTASSAYLFSPFSWGGFRGRVTFEWDGHGSNIGVDVKMEFATNSTPQSLENEPILWAIHEMPIRYDKADRCSPDQVGKKLIDLNSLLGDLMMPLTAIKVFETSKLAIVGPDSIWGRSLLMSSKSKVACSNIQGVGGELTYEARFHAPIAGSIWFRSWAWELGGANTRKLGAANTTGSEVVIVSDIFDVISDELSSSSHNWNLYITDILDDEKERSSCNFLTTVYDPTLKKACHAGVCPEGDLTSKYGKLLVPSDRSKFSRKSFHSSGPPFPVLSGIRQLYVGIDDSVLVNNVYACAKLKPIKAKKAKAYFSSNRVKGQILMEQSSVFAPTELTLDLHNLQLLAGGFHVHELPTDATSTKSEKVCSETGGHYNPYMVDPSSSPAPGLGTHDQYELGDLSGKHGMLLQLNDITATVIDHNLPLFGLTSVIGRSIVVHKPDASRWFCTNIRQNISQTRAVAVFRYPFVGEISFEQEMDEPLSDTTIIVGSLLYSDGSHNDTSEHDWFINQYIPGKDFYHWMNRCISAGAHFNPYKVSTAKKVYESCGFNNPERCEVGDLSNRLGPLRIAGSTETVNRVKMVLTDSNTPLSGTNSILHHSLVIQDKYGPQARGNRLGCTGILSQLRYKAVVNAWHSVTLESKLDGWMEFIQETPYDVTNVEVYLKGLQGIASGYHVHMVPPMIDLAFPCSASIVYGHFNPFNISAADSPPSGKGTDDQYELGDLSGKYGNLEGRRDVRGTYNDSNLPIFGPNSVIGRSVVIHKKEQAERWFCGTVVWGYAPTEARQVAAIASFHNPDGYAWGYIRMRQLVYSDGSMSETSIEVNLGHPGAYNKNVTNGHNWSVYVNPVGVDATVKSLQSRCVAAGYRWNPFHIQLAQPNDKGYYDKQCGPSFPLRCDAGDLSGRLGPVRLGEERVVFMDKNLPLAGDGEYSALGKSIVIHMEKGGADKFACANIQPDEDIVKWANIRRTAGFTVFEFMEDMRNIMGAPKWFLLDDALSYKVSADDQCVTFRILFMGPYAKRLERDFSSLLAGGVLQTPTVQTPGQHPDPKRKKLVSYRRCGGRDDDYGSAGIASTHQAFALCITLFLALLIA